VLAESHRRGVLMNSELKEMEELSHQAFGNKGRNHATAHKAANDNT
jgi:hypothetical protein